MSTETGATLTAVVGVLLARLALDGSFRRYVRPGMGVWLVASGVLLTLLGLLILWRQRGARRGDHADTADHPDHAGHDHPAGEHQERVGWLLLAPVLALLLIAPGPLGAFALDRTGSAVTLRSGGAVFAPLDPAGGPQAMTVIEFDQRAFDGTDGSSFNGAEVRLVGFVGPTEGGGFLVARYSIACCAADALAATALVTGWAGPVPPRDAWVEVTGRFEPGGTRDPRLVASSVAVVPPPDDPYE